MADNVRSAAGWDAMVEQERRKMLVEYLAATRLQPLWEEEYDAAMESFLKANVAQSEVRLPGPVVPLEKALEGCQPGCCGLSPAFLKVLFSLQHLRYSEEALRDEEWVYEARRVYYRSQNVKILQALQSQPADFYRAALVRWATEHPPLRLPVKVKIVTRTTPLDEHDKDGEIFYQVGEDLLGPGEPFEVDQSEYTFFKIFGEES